MEGGKSVYVSYRCNLSPPNIFNPWLVESIDLDHTDTKNQLYYLYKPRHITKRPQDNMCWRPRSKLCGSVSPRSSVGQRRARQAWSLGPAKKGPARPPYMIPKHGSKGPILSTKTNHLLGDCLQLGKPESVTGSQWDTFTEGPTGYVVTVYRHVLSDLANCLTIQRPTGTHLLQ